MFQHEKMLFHPVAVERPNAQYAALLQEQLGGANGELKAAMQYLSQSFRIRDPEIKGPFPGYRGGGTGPHGDGRPDHQSPERTRCGGGERAGGARSRRTFCWDSTLA